MKIKYQNLIWDWNGTLLNDAFACLYAMNVILRENNLPEMDEKMYMNVFSFPVKKYYEKLGFDFSVHDWELLARSFISIYNVKILEAELHDGVIETFEKLKGIDINMNILSACEISMLQKLVAKHEIDRYISRVAGLDHIYATSKTDIGRQLMETAGYSTSDTLMIGDTIHDFDVAEYLGIECVLVESGYQSRERLLSTGCSVLNSVRDILPMVII